MRNRPLAWSSGAKGDGFFNPARFDNGNKTMWATPPNPDNPNNAPVTGNLGFEDSSGQLLPPARNVIDILFAHRDSDNQLTMPRFLGKKLWEWFAYPNPSKALIDEIKNRASVGDIGGQFCLAHLVHLFDQFLDALLILFERLLLNERGDAAPLLPHIVLDLSPYAQKGFV